MVTRHGGRAADAIDIAECRPKSDAPDLRRFLLAAPDWDDDMDFPRNRDLPREVDFH